VRRPVAPALAAAAAVFFLSAGCLPTQQGASGGGSTNRRSRQKGVAGKASYDGPDKAITKHNLIANATFNDGTSLPWTVSFTAPGDGAAEIVDNALCLNVKNRGANNWDAQLRHREMTIEQGHEYTVSFKAHAGSPIKLRAKVGMQGPPYAEYWVDTLKIDETPRTFTGTFRMAKGDDPTAEFAFHVGGNLSYGAKEPFQVCIDDVLLEDAQFVRGETQKADELPKVLVNQTGYFPGLQKLAIVRSDAREPQAWTLRDASGHEVAAGKTIVAGPDAPSGDSVHVIDFTSYTKTGEGFTLAVGSDKSHPFDIRPDLYAKLKYQAMAFYYHNRSGIEIKLPYAEKKEWTRAAGHLSDKAVPCWPGSGCSYTLDVAGGWYDAGDHGKYVVNAGISVWTLLDLWERDEFVGKSTAAFADGKLNIPEKSNGVADLLDEVRWELEWELKMQVPAGEKLEGMVHHKVHDREWTALGLAPADDPLPRFLKPPSTAATLNLAANAAQAARIWKKIDPAFSAKCLEAAERAYGAALKNPAMFAPPGGLGGGPYDDTNVDDEFYWAAAELYVTTKKDEYKAAVQRSPYYLQVPVTLGKAKEVGVPSPLTWQETEAAGTISLAVVPNGLPAGDVAKARANLAKTAEAYLEIINRRGYRVPIEYGAKNQSPWGSNSFLLNNLIVLALAHDFTGQRRFLDGVVQGMDYVMGRNAMDQTYVTGYGERPLVNPHHRFWSFQTNNKFPKAPPGVVSGGPNSGLEDPYVQAAGLKGCAPEKCFVDNIEAWSANEITINWNAPFVWALAYLDGKGHAPPAPTASTKSAPPPKTKRPRK
jgi:endoglucanase